MNLDIYFYNKSSEFFIGWDLINNCSYFNGVLEHTDIRADTTRLLSAHILRFK